MAIIDFPAPILWPQPAPLSISGAPTFQVSTAMNASGDRLAFIVCVPKTGTLSKFECRTSTSATVVNGLRFSFQDIDVATGLPDLTVDQFCDVAAGSVATNTWLTPGDLTHDGTGGGIKRSVTAGDYLGCVVDFVSFNVGNALTLNSGISLGSAMNDNHETYLGDASTGTYTRQALTGAPFALKYDDGTYAAFSGWTVGGISALNTRSFSSSSTPDERGIVFIPPVTLKLGGVWIRITLNIAFDVVLYDAADAVVATTTINPLHRYAAAGVGIQASVRFASPPTLTAGATYPGDPGRIRVTFTAADLASEGSREMQRRRLTLAVTHSLGKVFQCAIGFGLVNLADV